MALSYTQRTLKELRDQGLPADIVERYVKQARKAHGVHKDLFNIIDIIALGGPARGIIGVQSTGPNGFADHKKKILEEYAQSTLDWLKSGGKLLLWSWRKKKVKKTGKAEVWVYKEYEFTLKDLEIEEEVDPFEGM